ncbi:MAG: hypothetical protein WCC28_06410 [Mycobacterium sp.]|uniref:hypothetical protein n=1 Tax=Mycobacterium sp. TaxID=1785 RepID=UPI003C778203
MNHPARWARPLPELERGRSSTRYRHGNATTDDFTGLAAGYCDESLSGLWNSWLYSRAVP